MSVSLGSQPSGGRARSPWWSGAHLGTAWLPGLPVPGAPWAWSSLGENSCLVTRSFRSFVCMTFTGGPERYVCSNLRLLGCPQEGRAAAGLAPGWGVLAVRARADVGPPSGRGLRAAVGRRDRATLPLCSVGSSQSDRASCPCC